MGILTEFLTNSTIHGLAYISNVPTKTGKAIWFTIVLAGFCTASYLIYTSYEEWETSPVATSISTHPIASLHLPITTICPPDNSNTALNWDMVRAGNIKLTDDDRQDLIDVSRQFLINRPGKTFIEVAEKITNKEGIPQLKTETRSFPLPSENTVKGRNKGFEIWSTELSGTYKTPGFGQTRNCTTDYPNILFTLYIPQKVVMEEEDLTDQTFQIEIAALNDGDFNVEYREGDKYVFIEHELKFWREAEEHCNRQNGHLVSIKTNYDFTAFHNNQERDNVKKKDVWLGGSDYKTESVWEWSDATSWANKTAPQCGKVQSVQAHGLKTCTNWAPRQPAGGREENCLVAGSSGTWKSDECQKHRKPFWCQIPPKKLESTKKLSWRLKDITFSKIGLWLVRKAEAGEKSCNTSSRMPGFQVTWSTTDNAKNKNNMSKVYKVTDVLKSDNQYQSRKKILLSYNSLNLNLKFKILGWRRANMTTDEMWGIVEDHKRNMAVGNVFGCSLGLVKIDDFRKVIWDMKTRIPKNRSTIAYTETAEDYTLAFDMFSYLVFCQREQIEMAAFYNNLFHTADTRTILQATVNNIQYGVEDAHTLMALRQIYKILAKKLDVRLPYMLQGFLDSSRLEDVDLTREMFLETYESNNIELQLPGKIVKSFWSFRLPESVKMFRGDFF